jgi:hypothetical protein
MHCFICLAARTPLHADSSSINAVSFSSTAQRNAARYRDARQQRQLFVRGNPPVGQLLEQPEDFEDNHDNDNYSDYIEDASAHAGD